MRPQVLKSYRIEQVKNWINTLTAHDDYARQKLSPYNGDELDKMTLKEVEMLLKFINVSFHVGYQKAYKN